MSSEDNANSPWLPFTSWLAQQRGEDENPEEQSSPSSSTDAPQTPSSSLPSTSTNTHAASAQQTTAHESTQPAFPTRRQGTSASLARDCRMETRLLDGAARGRQDMAIMLAAPGMPLHKSPFITTRQATSLLTALCEPLVQISVGRMTRHLESPTILHTTEDRGVLSLWLLPNDDLSLVWQGRVTDNIPPPPSANSPTPFRSSLSMPAAEYLARFTREGAAAAAAAAPVVQDVERVSAEVTVWEELARFHSGAHPGTNDPVITIHMLRGDATSRSFYIRPRADVANAHMEETAARAGALAAAGMFSGGYHASMGSMGGSSSSSSTSTASPHSHGAAIAAGAAAGNEEGRRMYFWLTGTDLNSAVRNLGRLKSLIKRPPTLSKRSGVAQKQLNQIASWLQQLDAVAHQQAAAMGLHQNTPLSGSSSTAAAPAAFATSPSTSTSQAPSNAAAAAASSSSNSSSSTSMAMLLGRQGASPLPAGRVIQQEGGRIAATGAVSATAATVYKDRRFNISFPCSITVGASVSLRGTPNSASVAGADGAARDLTTKATQQAKDVAEEVARRTVDRIGRRNLEEAICESLIRSVRAQRAKSKAEVQAERDRQTRQEQAQQAQPLIRKAVEHAVAKGGMPTQSCKVQMALHVAAAGGIQHASTTGAVQGDQKGATLMAPLTPLRCNNSANNDESTESSPRKGNNSEAPSTASEEDPDCGDTIALNCTMINSSSAAAAAAAAAGGGGGGGSNGTARSSSVSLDARGCSMETEAEAEGGSEASSHPSTRDVASPPTPAQGRGAASASAAGRVTIDDFQTLLNAGNAAAAADQPSTGKVSIAELQELLQTQHHDASQ